MDIQKIYKLHEILNGRRIPISKADILEKMECSESTFKRVREYMQDHLNAQIDYLLEQNGYLYANQNYELPGLWFGTDELLALVSLEKLLSGLNVSVLNTHLMPFKARIDKLLINQSIKADNLHRMRILPINARINKPDQFQHISVAVVLRKCLHITYHARGSNEISQRTISPQRLLHYRDNWYLDAWCHLKNQLRTFAIDRIQQLQNSQTPCIDITDDILDAHFKSGYGIFSGEAKYMATLIFSANRARWVADEAWHPDQKFTWLSDGRYQLEVPYADERELIMDVMRHLPEVEVVSPASLKHLLVQHLEESIKKHQ